MSASSDRSAPPPTGRPSAARRKRRSPAPVIAPRPSATRRWTARLIAAGAVVSIAGVVFLLFAVAGLQVALRFREVPVPDLVGLSRDQAATTLGRSGLQVRVEPLPRIDPGIPAGHVADQDPASGLTTRSGRSVKVWLSSGASAGSVPTLIGQSERGARARLEEDALRLRGVSEIRSNRYPSDSVVAQEPPPLGSASNVSVLVNRGERGATYVMPDLIGVQGDAAAEVLRARGFRVSVVGDHPYPIEPGVVLRQFPQAGFQIAHGEAISLEVSR